MTKYRIGTYERNITESANLPFPENNVSYVVGTETRWTIFKNGKQMLLDFDTKAKAQEYFLAHFTSKVIEKEVKKLNKELNRRLKTQEAETKKWFKQAIERVKASEGILDEGSKT